MNCPRDGPFKRAQQLVYRLFLKRKACVFSRKVCSRFSRIFSLQVPFLTSTQAMRNAAPPVQFIAVAARLVNNTHRPSHILNQVATPPPPLPPPNTHTDPLIEPLAELKTNTYYFNQVTNTINSIHILE